MTTVPLTPTINATFGLLARVCGSVAAALVQLGEVEEVEGVNVDGVVGIVEVVMIDGSTTSRAKFPRVMSAVESRVIVVVVMLEDTVENVVVDLAHESQHGSMNMIAHNARLHLRETVACDVSELVSKKISGARES